MLWLTTFDNPMVKFYEKSDRETVSSDKAEANKFVNGSAKITEKSRLQYLNSLQLW